MSDLLGQCACGKVTYEIRGNPLVTQVCHCLDCQRTTGSAFVVHMVVCEEDFAIEGETRMGLGPTGSDHGCELHACAACGVIIWARYRYHKVPVIAVRAGTLSRPDAVTPAAHIFTRSKLPWVSPPAGVPAFAEGVDRDRVWPRESIERYESLAPLK